MKFDMKAPCEVKLEDGGWRSKEYLPSHNIHRIEFGSQTEQVAETSQNLGPKASLFKLKNPAYN
jgi:hypothetical protein